MPLAPPEAGLTARTWLTVVFASAATEWACTNRHTRATFSSPTAE